MIYRLVFLAALLGIANALVKSCHYCVGHKCSDGSAVKTCSAQTGGMMSSSRACVSMWMNQDLAQSGCAVGQQLVWPDDAEQFGAYKCKTTGTQTMCWCTSDNCNKDTTIPAGSGADGKAEAEAEAEAEPGNGADGKVGGVANAAQSCYNCAGGGSVPPNAAFGPKCSDGSVAKTCSAQSGGVTTAGLCVSRWMNQTLYAQACMPGKVDGNAMPDNFEQCGAYKCMFEGSETICVCTSDNCNKDNTVPTNCGAQASEPENGADGKVGGVFSILLSAILATIF